MSTTIKLSGKNSILQAKFFPPLQLEKDSEICLLSLIFWHSIPNIDDSNQNFYYNDGKKDDIIIIPHGSYELEDLESYLQESMRKVHKQIALNDEQKILLRGDNPILLTGNTQTLKSEMVCRYAVDFTKENNIGQILGFAEKTAPFEKVISENMVQILQVDVIRVECNLSMSSFENGISNHSVYEFFPSVPPGYKIVEIPQNLIYYRLNTRNIPEIEIKLTDQDGKLLNLRGETIHARFHIRPIS